MIVRAMLDEGVSFAEEWYSIFTFQYRRMEHCVHDNILFSGDSAHLVSPDAVHAALILLLANHIGDDAAVSEAIALAGRERQS